MRCPKCQNIELKPTKLEDGLLAMGCVKCQGASVSLLYYRDWVERTGSLHNAPDVTLLKGLDSEDTAAALSCPKCAKIMQKYRISGCSSNRLDLCQSCDEAWLDGGEWELLKALELSKEIPLVFSEQWQSQVRKDVSDEIRRQRFAKILSPQDLEKSDQLRDWLKDHPNKADIIFYINHD
ncbi:hypothetical protein [Aliikangiella sp. IMCC44632]